MTTLGLDLPLTSEGELCISVNGHYHKRDSLICESDRNWQMHQSCHVCEAQLFLNTFSLLFAHPRGKTWLFLIYEGASKEKSKVL